MLRRHFLIAEASVDLTKSRYDKSLGALNARESQALDLSGVSNRPSRAFLTRAPTRA